MVSCFDPSGLAPPASVCRQPTKSRYLQLTHTALLCIVDCRMGRRFRMLVNGCTFYACVLTCIGWMRPRLLLLCKPTLQKETGFIRTYILPTKKNTKDCQPARRRCCKTHVCTAPTDRHTNSITSTGITEAAVRAITVRLCSWRLAMAVQMKDRCQPPWGLPPFHCQNSTQAYWVRKLDDDAQLMESVNCLKWQLHNTLKDAADGFCIFC